MFVVCVRFKVKPDQLAAFEPLVQTNAAASLALEPACHRFDVCQKSTDPCEIFLYEVYDDAAAFESHKQMPHFVNFDAAALPMVAEKQVSTYRLKP